MQHIAIMSKQFGDLIGKILNGEKKIESRWSINKIAPFNKIKAGETVWFKNSGGPVIARAKVSKVMQFDNLNPEKVNNILDKWGGEDGIDVTDLEKTKLWAKNKRYCVLIYLKNTQKVESFYINKKGFGSAVAWLCVKSINEIKIT